jgi:hypothetical protein
VPETVVQRRVYITQPDPSSRLAQVEQLRKEIAHAQLAPTGLRPAVDKYVGMGL